MRECIYCGRQLEKGEQCTCAMSVAKRREREQAKQTEQPGSRKEARAEEKNRRKQERGDAKRREREARSREREARRSTRRAAYNYSRAYRSRTKTAFGDVWQLFRSFLRSPIETVMNPGMMSVPVIMIFVVIEGIISGLSIFSIISGASRGPLRLLGSLMGFRGVQGYDMLLGWLSSAFSGAVGGIAVFFIGSGIFYLINRWIFKQFTPYWEFSKRFALVGIPYTVIGAVGVLLGFFSQTTFAVLMIVGIVGTVVLLYEILRSAWYSRSAAKVMYMMLLGVFVFLMIALYIVRISVF